MKQTVINPRVELWSDENILVWSKHFRLTPGPNYRPRFEMEGSFDIHSHNRLPDWISEKIEAVNPDDWILIGWQDDEFPSLYGECVASWNHKEINAQINVLQPT